MVKNLLPMQEIQEAGSLPGSRRSPGGGGSIFAWKIPWTEEPGRLQSVDWDRVGHD